MFESISILRTRLVSIIRLFIGVILTLSCNSASGQKSADVIKIDGSIHFSETQESDDWKTVRNSQHILIRESSESFYIGIKSDTYTSANVYINNVDTINIYHISYSLGDTKYINNTDHFNSVDSVYRWKFKDPAIRSKISNIPVEKELENFFLAHNWVANTMPLGSYRELEILISKILLPKLDMLCLSYLSKDQDGNNQLSYFPQEVTSITNDQTLDRELQNGNLPMIQEFRNFTSQ